VALGGSTGLFDYESTDNPASIASTRTCRSVSSCYPERRSVETPAGSDTIKTYSSPCSASPALAGRQPLGLGLSFSNYTSRDFQVVSKHSEIIRGVPVDVTDSLTSRGRAQ
jgi:hypothetical protein